MTDLVKQPPVRKWGAPTEETIYRREVIVNCVEEQKRDQVAERALVS